MSADTTTKLNSTHNVCEYLLGLSDGTITRIPTDLRKISPTPDPNQPGLQVVPSKDVTINEAKNTWARIFLPRDREALDSSSKIPIIVYYHGGGFVLGNVADPYSHDFCEDMASQLPAVVVSISYRLAPEHRLPAAYDDAEEALHWIKTNRDCLLNDYADLNRCWIMGGSAGANIAYHAGLRAAAQVDDLVPMKIRGIILQQPYFGGIQRTESELRLVNDPVFPADLNDLMWDLSLPVGGNRDHEYCNPMLGDGKKLLDKVGGLGWKVMVIGCNEDPLIDRQISLVEMLKEKGVQVEHQFDEGGFHGSTIIEPSSKIRLLHVLKNLCSSL